MAVLSLATIAHSSVVIDIEKLMAKIPDNPVVFANQLVVGDDDSIIDSVDSSSAEKFPDDSGVSDSDESSQPNECGDEEDDDLPQIREIPGKQKRPLHSKVGRQARTTTNDSPACIKNSSNHAKRRVNLDQFPDNLLVDIFYQMLGNIGLERAWRNMAKMRVLNKCMNAVMGMVVERLSIDHPFFANQSRLIELHRALSQPRLLHTWTSKDQTMYEWLERKSLFKQYMRTFVRQNDAKSLLFDTSIPTKYLCKKEARIIMYSLWCVLLVASAAIIILFAEYYKNPTVYLAFLFWALCNWFVRPV